MPGHYIILYLCWLAPTALPWTERPGELLNIPGERGAVSQSQRAETGSTVLPPTGGGGSFAFLQARLARTPTGHSQDEVFWGLLTSRLSLRETKVVSASPSRAPSAPGLARRRRRAGRAAARPLASRPVRRSVRLLSSSPQELLLGGAGGGGRLRREETFATFLHSFSSTPHSPVSLQEKKNVERG